MTAAIFWLKTRAGWKETMVSDLAGAKGDEPLTVIIRKFVDPVRDAHGLLIAPADHPPAIEYRRE